MIVTLISLAILLAGCAGVYFFDSEGAGLLFCPAGAVVLLISVIFIILAPITIQADLAEYSALKDSLALARGNSTSGPNLSVEMAAIQGRLIDFNRGLARKQFWAKSPWTNWFVSKRVFEMTPIQ